MERPVLHAPVLLPCVSHAKSHGSNDATTFISDLQRVVSGLFHYGFMATNRHRNIMGGKGINLITSLHHVCDFILIIGKPKWVAEGTEYP